MTVLAIDIGTSNFKVALFCGDECVLFHEVSIPNWTKEPPFELDVSIWLSAFDECLSYIDANGFNRKTINKLLVSGNGPSLIPVLRGGKNWGKASLWLDGRFFIAKAEALKANHPDIYDQTEHFLGATEALTYVLSGVPVSILPSPALQKWYWDDAKLQAAGLDAGKFPGFVRPGAFVGKVCAEAARVYGLSADADVCAGAPDFYAALCGCGVTRPGQCLDRGGTSEGLNVCVEHPVEVPGGMCYEHPCRPFWNVSKVLPKADRIGNEGGTFSNIMEEIKALGIPVTEIFSSGGPATNDSLCQAKADAAGLVLHALKLPAEIVGLGILGGVKVVPEIRKSFLPHAESAKERRGR
jgi:xylulokinase